jgi:hypothetical protein
MAAAAPTDAVRRGHGPALGASSSSMAPLLTSSRSRSRVRWPEELPSAVHRVRASSLSPAKASDLRAAMAEARQRRPQPVRRSCWEDCLLPRSRPLVRSVSLSFAGRAIFTRIFGAARSLRCGFARSSFTTGQSAGRGPRRAAASRPRPPDRQCERRPAPARLPHERLDRPICVQGRNHATIEAQGWAKPETGAGGDHWAVVASASRLVGLESWRHGSTISCT